MLSSRHLQCNLHFFTFSGVPNLIQLTLDVPRIGMKSLKELFCRKPAASSKAMKLGGKSKDVDSFVDQLKSEGENVVIDANAVSSKNVTKSVSPSLPQVKAER